MQRSQIFFVIYMEKVRKVLRTRRRPRSLSRNSRWLYRSGDARGAYRSTLGYEFKVAHLAFQRGCAGLSCMSSYHHIRIVNMRAINAKLVGLFKVISSIRVVCIDIFDWRKEKVARIIQCVMYCCFDMPI